MALTVLDSSFLIDLSRGHAGAKARWEGLLGNETLRVPAAAWMEYLHVFDAERRLKAQAELERHASFEPFTKEMADLGARLQNGLRAMGRPMGWHDLQIACTALHLGDDVASNDPVFDAVPGLVRLGW